jgi:tetratricopeptide (TPR) repeat protein
VDLVEAMTVASFMGLGLWTQRFLGIFALIVTPYLARALSEWMGARRWPRAFASPWVRAAAVGVVCVAMSVPEWSRPELALGIGFDPREIPREACDAMARFDIRGRGFNDFQGGYLLDRFWPDRSRLPFMDVHQAGTTEIRRLYAEALSGEDGWRALDRRFQFDYVIAQRRPGAESLLDALDADTTFRAVFVDDVVALLVRRRGPYAALAEREGYRIVPIGPVGRSALRAACATDTLLRALAIRELERQTSATWCASAHDLWGELEAVAGHLESARGHFEQATLNDPLMVGPRERLGLAEMMLGSPDRALREFQRESRLRGAGNGIDLRLGQAYRRLGRLQEARAAFRKEIERGPWKQEATDSLAALERTAG